MTVIALLNVESDPHILADTLLTVEGCDPREYKSVWLPSVGQIPSQCGTPTEPLYIARLGRKTFFLPNYGGVIAFSGDCKAAFSFWAELSANVMNVAGYHSGLLIDRRMLDQALSRVDHGKFALLGLIKNEQGGWEVFTHNQHTVVQTQSFGTCYLAGSGVPLLENRILARDRHVQSTRRPNVKERITHTENLAEGISSDLLYDESDHQSGLDRNLSAYSCGGFYEWYRLVQAGVRQMPARLDIHVTQVDDSPVITRLYLIETLQQRESIVDPISTQKYLINIISIVLDPIKPSLKNDGGWLVSSSEMIGVAIESTFELYDAPEKSGRLSGPVPEEQLARFFAEPFNVNRIRLICSNNGLAKSRSISRSAEEPDTLATLSFKGGLLHVDLSEAVTLAAQLPISL
jgi:hypothetical protein